MTRSDQPLLGMYFSMILEVPLVALVFEGDLRIAAKGIVAAAVAALIFRNIY